jgi:hypothetical protein
MIILYLILELLNKYDTAMPFQTLAPFPAAPCRIILLC